MSHWERHGHQRSTIERQIERVERTLDEPATPAETLDAVFTNLSDVHWALGICKVIGYLDILERRERVRADERDGRIVYERTSE